VNDCATPESELLHFLAAGTLSQAEREQVRRHVADCEACRTELRELELLMADVRALHLAPEELAAAAEQGRPPEHLRECASCSQEYELLQRVNRDLDGQPARAGWRLHSGWAAGLAASLLIGWNLWLVDQNRELARKASAVSHEQAAALQTREQAAAALASRVQELEAEVGTLSRPALNVTVVDVEPPAVVRGRPAEPHDLTVQPGTEALTLILSAPGVAHHVRYGLEVVTREGRPVWNGAGLRRSEFDTFLVSFPARLLPPAIYVLRLKDPGAVVLREWTLRVRAPA